MSEDLTTTFQCASMFDRTYKYAGLVNQQAFVCEVFTFDRQKDARIFDYDRVAGVVSSATPILEIPLQAKWIAQFDAEKSHYQVSLRVVNSELSSSRVTGNFRLAATHMDGDPLWLLKEVCGGVVDIYGSMIYPAILPAFRKLVAESTHHGN